MQATVSFRRRLVAALALLPLLLRARPADAAPGLVLADEAATDLDPAGYLVSEKYDGVRALRDGSTLRFRSGQPVAAPARFTARLPATALDGELWLGRSRFEELSGLVRRVAPADDDWRHVRYMIFELPGAAGTFEARAERIRDLAGQCAWPQLTAAEQRPVASRRQLQQWLDDVVAGGGEGLMLHRSSAPYRTGRSRDLLKLKPLHDAEAQITGHVAGRGRHAGRLGALRVRTQAGVEFLLGSGFSDAQRERPPALGALVTFSHRGFTAAGVPRFASFLRAYDL
jgi:DNA ligase-1